MGLIEDIKTFSQLIGPSGAEDAVISEFCSRIRSLGYEPGVDPLGNVIVPINNAEAEEP